MNPKLKERSKEIVENASATCTSLKKHLGWNGYAQEANDLYHEHTGKREQGGCFACQIRVLDWHRGNIGLGPLCESTDEKTAKERLAICLKCPKLSRATGLKGEFPWFRAKKNTCESCGCLVRAKVLLKSEQCPEGKW